MSAAVTVREVSAGEAGPILAPVTRYATTDETVEQVAALGRCYVIEQDGRPVAGYVLQRQGDECFVLAAAGSVDFDLTDFGLRLIEAHAVGLASVAFQTRRPGLVKKAARLGYRIAGRVKNGHGVIMRKELK